MEKMYKILGKRHYDIDYALEFVDETTTGVVLEDVDLAKLPSDMIIFYEHVIGNELDVDRYRIVNEGEVVEELFVDNLGQWHCPAGVKNRRNQILAMMKTATDLTDTIKE